MFVSCSPRIAQWVVFSALGLFASSSGAVSSYIPGLKTIVLDNEPCFYAETARDVKFDKGEEVEVKKAVLTVGVMGDTEISQRPPENVVLSTAPDRCIKLSNLFPSEITRIVQPDVRYNLAISIGYKSKGNTKGSKSDALKYDPKSLPLVPEIPDPELIPPYSEFVGTFCLKANAKGKLEMDKQPNVLGCGKM